MTDFPSEAYKELCIENAEKLRGLREPRSLDFMYDAKGGEVFSLPKPLIGWGPLPAPWIPLPTLSQLVRMLEERGYDWSVGRCLEEPGKFSCWTMPMEDWRARRWDRRLSTYGPSPETAALLALIEIMELKLE